MTAELETTNFSSGFAYLKTVLIGLERAGGSSVYALACSTSSLSDILTMTNYWDAITPDVVLKFDGPAEGYLCPLSANTYGIEFLKFEVKDYDTGKVVYQVSREPEQEPLPDDLPPEIENMIRSVQYAFPAAFLSYKTVRTSLEFSVGDKPLNNFRMIERHYFKNKLIRSYDFTFGFCIPCSTNSWEAIYDVPPYSNALIDEYVNSPNEHKSDSFYFVDDKLVMHNKAEYKYVRD